MRQPRTISSLQLQSAVIQLDLSHKKAHSPSISILAFSRNHTPFNSKLPTTSKDNKTASTMSKASTPASHGQALWNKTPKANAELFALTYGALVTEVIRDSDEDVAKINESLENIGYSIGIRCVDEFLAKSTSPHSCQTFQDTAEVLGRTAFRMFLGIIVDVQHSSDSSFRLLFQDNPLALFVELPEQFKDLEYNILYCGVIRGALEMLNYKVDCTFLKSPLKGDDVHEIKVDLKQVVAAGAGDDYKEE